MGILYAWSSNVKGLFRNGQMHFPNTIRTSAERDKARETQKVFNGIGPVFATEKKINSLNYRSSQRVLDGLQSGVKIAPSKVQRRPDVPQASSAFVDIEKAFDNIKPAGFNIEIPGKRDNDYDRSRKLRRSSARKDHNIPTVPNTDFTFSDIPTFTFQDLQEVFDRLDSVKAESELKHPEETSKVPRDENADTLFQKLPIIPKASSESIQDNASGGLFRSMRKGIRKPSRVPPLVKTPGLFTKMTPNVKVDRSAPPRRTSNNPRAKRSNNNSSPTDDQFTKWGLIIGVVAFSLFLLFVLLCVCCKWNSFRRSSDGKDLIPDFTPPIFSVTEGYDNVACEDDLQDSCAVENKTPHRRDHNKRTYSLVRDHLAECDTVNTATTSV